MGSIPTLSDIASASGVSRSAVARVLLGTGGDHVRVSDLTRQRIEKTAERLHYTPNRFAQGLRGVASKTLGVILDTVNTPVMSQRLFALEREAAKLGYRLLIGHIHGETEALADYISDFSGRAVEGILCLFDLAPGRDARAQQCFKHFRKVVFHGRPAWPGGYCLRVDTEAAIEFSVKHLIAQGKRRIALSLSNSLQDELVNLRLESFKSLSGKMATHFEAIIWDVLSSESGPSPDIIESGIQFMIEEKGADAILAPNDTWAVHYILQLQKRGLNVPRDVAVIGYDNLDIAKVISPSLTTIDQRHEDYAGAALQLLLKVAGDKRISKAQRTETISPRLIVREST